MSLPPETVERVQAYLKKQAALPLADTIADVRASADELQRAAHDVADFDRQPVPDDWSAHECLVHVVEWNLRNAREILYVALSGELPQAEVADLPVGCSALIAHHDVGIESLFAHVLEASPDAFLHVTWDHPFFGPLNWREWFAFLAVHS